MLQEKPKMIFVHWSAQGEMKYNNRSNKECIINGQQSTKQW